MWTLIMGKALLAISLIVLSTSIVLAGKPDLPIRTSPIPETTDGVPHVQIGVAPVPELSAELLERVSRIPGVDIRDTIISMPGAKGFWIDEELVLQRPGAIIRGREFAHIHPDGSLHASLSPALANQAVESGWAIHHPWSNQRSGWEGFVMIYTPGTKAELETVLQLVFGSYNYVTGEALNPVGG